MLELVRPIGSRLRTAAFGSRRTGMVYVEVAVAMTTVGASAVLGKRMAEELPIAVGSAVRFGLAALVLPPLLVWQEGGVPRLGRREGAMLVVQSCCGSVGFALLWLAGLRLTTASAAAIVTSTTPAVIAAASWLVLRETLRRRQAAAIVLAVGGVAAMTALGNGVDGSGGASAIAGNLLVAGAVLCEAIFVVLGKRAGAKLSPLAIATGVTVVSFAYFLPVAVVEATTVDLTAVSRGAWFAVVGYALGPTALGYVLIYHGLTRLSAATAGIFTGIVPISAVGLAALLLGERVGRSDLVGMVAVLVAIVVGTADRRPASESTGPALVAVASSRPDSAVRGSAPG